MIYFIEVCADPVFSFPAGSAAAGDETGRQSTWTSPSPPRATEGSLHWIL